MNFARGIISKSTFVVLMLSLVACGGSDGESDEDSGSDDSYSVSDTEAFEAGQGAIEAHGAIDSQFGDASVDNSEEIFSSVQSDYEDNLQQQVSDTTDPHEYGSESIGTFLDTMITDAVELGKTAESAEDIEYAGQIIDKSLLVYFYFAAYEALDAGEQSGLDRALGLWGLTSSGEPNGGLAANARAREQEFGLTINGPIFEAFIDAQSNIGAEGYEGAVDTIDKKMLETLTAYARHEFAEYDGEPAVKLIEARIIYEGVRPWAEANHSEINTSIMEGMYPNGVPEADSASYYTTGLEAVRNDPSTIDVDGLSSDLESLMDDLAN